MFASIAPTNFKFGVKESASIYLSGFFLCARCDAPRHQAAGVHQSGWECTTAAIGEATSRHPLQRVVSEARVSRNESDVRPAWGLERSRATESGFFERDGTPRRTASDGTVPSSPEVLTASQSVIPDPSPGSSRTRSPRTFPGRCNRGRFTHTPITRFGSTLHGGPGCPVMPARWELALPL